MLKRILIVLTLLLSLGMLASCDDEITPEVDESDYGLARVRDQEELEELLEEERDESMNPEYVDSITKGRTADEAMVPEGTDGEGSLGETEDPHSETNVQVEGVDEGDIIKTDGRRIYRIKYNELQVVELLGDGKMEIVLEESMKSTNEERSNTYYSDLYLTDRYLVVVGQRYHHFLYARRGGLIEGDTTAEAMPSWYHYGVPQTMVMVYDIENLEVVDRIEIAGNLMATRLIDDELYAISNQYVYWHDEIDPRPIIRHDEDLLIPEYEQIKYVPEQRYQSYTLITRVTLDDEVKVDYDVFLGAFGWGQVYVSPDAIYLATTTYFRDAESGAYRSKGQIISYLIGPDGSVSYGGAGSYQGYVINQFAMDEYDGTFRMVTTEGWGDDVKNRLYVFERETVEGERRLKRIGFLDEGIGKPRETVRSVRFNEDLVTVVTYEQIDPLYTIDLSDPRNPFIRAGLEVTGYSTYQHPWLDDYLIGVGYEAEGTEIEGLKLSLYDISDTDDPVEVGDPLVLSNGENGWTYSEALTNHKAILIGEERGILGFSISRSHYNRNNYVYSSDYLVFGVNVDSKKPIWIDASISHIDFFFNHEDTYAEYNRNAHDFSIERAVYVGDYLYVISGEAVTSHDMDDDYERVETLRFLLDSADFLEEHDGS
ncbi:MAG: beta-propeller domain-containing protein [Acholeplasmataceae bacterium]